mgnify:CR=1 FL=1
MIISFGYKQNSDLMLGIVGSFAGPVTLDAMRDQFAQQAVKPFQWYIFLFQLIGNAIFCGIFDTLRVACRKNLSGRVLLNQPLPGDAG